MSKFEVFVNIIFTFLVVWGIFALYASFPIVFYTVMVLHVIVTAMGYIKWWVDYCGDYYMTKEKNSDKRFSFRKLFEHMEKYPERTSSKFLVYLVKGSYDKESRWNFITRVMTSQLIYAFTYLNLGFIFVGGFMMVVSISLPLIINAYLVIMNRHCYNNAVSAVKSVENSQKDSTE